MSQSAVEPPPATPVVQRQRPAKHAGNRVEGQPRSLANRIMWLVMLWCAGIGATFIVVLPFHLLVQWAIHH